MKTIKTILSSSILLPIVSAIMLGLTRTTLPLDMLVFVAFVPLFYFFETTFTAKNKMLFLSGAIFSTIYMLVSQHWITLVTPGGFIGMLFIFAAVFGLMFIVVAKMYRRKPFLYPLSLIFIWLTFEYIINFSEFRFPWFNISYGLKNSLSLLQVLEFGGVFFASFLILLVNYLFYLGMTIKRKVFIYGFVMLLLWFFLGNVRLRHVSEHSQDTDFTISLIQGNIEQDLKWEQDMQDETFYIYETLSREVSAEHSPDLIVFPEAALPVHLLYERLYFHWMMNLVNELQTPIYTGFPHYEMEFKYDGQDSPFLYFNAANLFTSQGYDYDKNYYKNILVPFGERTPLLHVFPILWKIQMGQANFEMGAEMVRYTVDDYSFMPLICFEVAFPLFIADNVREHDPDFILNITNDAWFYRSMGTHQHGKMAVFRTIETRKPIFRVANTGYTFWTTPDGKMHQTTQLFERTTITGNLETYDTKTPFVSYGYRIPLIFILLFTGQILHTFILLFTKG